MIPASNEVIVCESEGILSGGVQADRTADRYSSIADEELNSLIRAIGKGCSASFSTLYEKTRKRLFRIVFRIVRDYQEAEDVLQEVFVKIWSRCRQFDHRRGHGIHWLLRIAQNGAIDWVRRRNVGRQVECRSASADDDTQTVFHSPESDPLDLAIRARASCAVRRCVEEVPTEQRDCLSLAFYGDMSHSQIASLLGVPLGTVKTWLRRSLIAMRPELELHR